MLWPLYLDFLAHSLSLQQQIALRLTTVRCTLTYLARKCMALFFRCYSSVCCCCYWPVYQAAAQWQSISHGHLKAQQPHICCFSIDFYCLFSLQRIQRSILMFYLLASFLSFTPKSSATFFLSFSLLSALIKNLFSRLSTIEWRKLVLSNTTLPYNSF